MLMKASEWLVSVLFPDLQDNHQRIACSYGCELWLYTFISTIGLLLIGLLMQSFFESAIIITIFYICQSNGGGFHASSHIRCFITMSIGLFAGLIMLYMPISQVYLLYMGMVSILILLAVPIRLHPYKQYLKSNKRILCIRSYAVTAVIALCVFALFLVDGGSLFGAGCIGILLSALSRIFAVTH